MSFKDRIPSSFYWLLLWIALKCFQAVVFVYCPAFIIVTDEGVNSIQSTPAFQELDLSTSQWNLPSHPTFCTPAFVGVLPYTNQLVGVLNSVVCPPCSWSESFGKYQPQ